MTESASALTDFLIREAHIWVEQKRFGVLLRTTQKRHYKFPVYDNSYFKSFIKIISSNFQQRVVTIATTATIATKLGEKQIRQNHRSNNSHQVCK